jgi:hypothetical protein
VKTCVQPRRRVGPIRSPPAMGQAPILVALTKKIHDVEIYNTDRDMYKTCTSNLKNDKTHTCVPTTQVKK